MNLAFDTSVLVAAILESHQHHARTLPWIQAVASGRARAMVTWHAVAETWSVLTRLPGTLRLPASSAHLVIQRLLETFEIVELSSTTYRAALRRCAERDLGSGAIFDALHLLSAEKHEARALVTFNRADFVRLRTDASPEVLVPPEPPAFSL